MKKSMFISQPISGLDKEDVQATRDRITEENPDYFQIENFFEDLNGAFCNDPILFLSRSIELMSHADVVYFAKGWQDYRGCRVEHAVATEYGIKIMEEE